MPCCEIHPRVMTLQEQQRELEDPLECLPPGELERRSPVSAFYEGAAVFLTGATGFVGTLLLEKLLRSCPGVSTVYVLVRDKKGVPLRERLRSHLDKMIFSQARQACPDYLHKVVPIAGDCSQPGLGISAADAAELCSKVSVVFHLAATVRFDADLRTATVTNVASTFHVVSLAKQMPNLKAFVYMSTAYSNAHMLDIEETFYPPALKGEELLKLISVMDDEQLAQIVPLLLGDSPNTYTFSKSVAEDVIRANATGLPVSIIRPSIVTNTVQEPLALWLANMYGPTAVQVGSLMGLLHSLRSNSCAVVDAVPADMVANATIACAWDTWTRYSTQFPTQRTPIEPYIYNCVSSTRHPITWGDVAHCSVESSNYPSIRNIYVFSVLLFKEKYLYIIGAVFFHLIPAFIADTYLRLMGMKPILWNIYSRVHEASQVLEVFSIREWKFKDDNMVSLLGRLGATDRKLFPFDITDCDWEWHITNSWRGVRLYLLDESFDNLEAARKKYRRLTALHYLLITLGSALLLLTLWQILTVCLGL